MAPGWREIASQHVHQITGRVREMLSSGLGFLEADLGSSPDLFAPWVLVFTAWIGLALLLVVWVSVCRRLTGEAPPTKKTDEERKRRNRRRKAEKAKKNKKKQKASVKEQKSAPEGKEPDEGTWETKISNREKRQQRRTDKPSGDESVGDISVMELQTSEDPETITRSSAFIPADQRDVESVFTSAVRAEAVLGNPPATKESYEHDAVAQKACWEEVSSVSRTGWTDLSPQGSAQMISVQTDSWTAEPSVWPQDMEGSWTFVDGSHIPVTFSGLTAVPDVSWSQTAPVDDEWSGIYSASADPSGDWNAPSEEWANYVEEQPISTVPVPLHQPIPAEQQQESDVEKDEAGAPGSVKSRKKKKKKKKTNKAAQIQVKAERDLSSGPQIQNETVEES